MDGDAVIPGSTRILRYLEEKWPDPPLFPGDAARRAELDAFLDWFNEVWRWRRTRWRPSWSASLPTRRR